MKVAVEGCAHGEMEKIYESIEHLELKDNVKIDLLICCGDFQATRNLQDLKAMAVPAKYQSMCSFYKYYSGEKVAPKLTIFIGGNHEASNHLQELPYGGWVAPNIFYMGYANVINIAGVRIAGLSGIYKGHDYMKGRFEKPPYTDNTKRSVYHVRNLDVFRLKQLEQHLDIFLSHDWPRGVHQFGDESVLLKQKPFFRDDIQSNSLGSKPCEELLHLLKPTFWFSAHLHVKFAALIPHALDSTNGEKKITKFLALDKCLPRRKFLQIIDIPHDNNKTMDIEYDLEWMTILYLTNHLVSVKNYNNYMPGPGGDGRWIYSPTTEEIELVREKFGNDFRVPKNFTKTVTPYQGNKDKSGNMISAQLNPQTITFCDQLGIDDPLALLLGNANESVLSSSSISSYTLPSSLTPERSGDITRVSFNDSSECSIYGDNSEVEVGSLQSSPPLEGGSSSSTPLSMRKFSLVLPSPRNSDEDSFSKVCEEDAPDHSRCSDGFVSQESDVDDLNTSCDDGMPSASEASPGHMGSSQDIQEVGDNSQPKVKKFRRRNQALYSSADED